MDNQEWSWGELGSVVVNDRPMLLPTRFIAYHGGWGRRETDPTYQKVQAPGTRRGRNTMKIARHLPNAEVRVYSDSGHGFLDQYPTLFADHVNAFLSGR